MRGDGRIFQRNGIWWCAYYLNGEEYRQSCKTTDGKSAQNEKEAQRFLRKRLKEVGADQLGLAQFVTPKANRLTCHDLLTALETNFKTRGKLSAQNASNLKRADTDFGKYRATALTPKQIEDYANARQAASDAKASVNRTTQLLSQAYRLAVKRGELHRVPHFTRLDESDNVREGFFEPAEFYAVHSHLPEYLKDFAEFAFITGCVRRKSSRWRGRISTTGPCSNSVKKAFAS